MTITGGYVRRPRTLESQPEERSVKGRSAMTNINTNTGHLDPLFHPASHYASPDDVLSDNEPGIQEKRIILSSWASDVFAVESRPDLRDVPGMGHAIRLADILAALRRLDGDDDPPPPGGLPIRLRRPRAAVLRSYSSR
jgi:hypothetical protein